MIDIQSERDTRGVYLKNVGVKNLRMPVKVTSGDFTISTVALISAGVGLDKEEKGTHMSRFVYNIHEMKNIDINSLDEVLRKVKRAQNSSSAFMTLSFPFFYEKTAPASSMKSLSDVNVEIDCSMVGDTYTSTLKVEVPITTLCPCSKAISKYGAHNQRTMARVKLNKNGELSIPEIIDIVEKNASCEVYSLLKRPDEKYVTERAYENPKFVEDVARDIYLSLEELDGVKSFDVEVESIESIHNHNAYARAVKEEVFE